MNALEIANQGFVPPAAGCIATQGFICANVVPPTPETEVSGGGLGNTDWLKKKRVRTIRRADFVHQQEYADAVSRAAAALAAESIAMPRVGEFGAVRDDELEDDDIILMALTRILH